MSALSEKNSDQNRKIVVVQGKDIYEYRAFYKKFERAKYISHLDLYRAIQRTFQRANIPVWYTEGYHPHIYLTFPMPIFLGCEGVEESFDFRTTVDCPPSQLMEQLNAAFPEGIRITKVQAPVHKASEIAKADYTLLFTADELDNASLLGKWESFVSQPQIPATKHTKKGPKEIDLKPMIYAMDTKLTEKGLLVQMQVCCGIEQNLNATLVTDAFASKEGLSLNYHLIRREQMLMENGEKFS